MFNKLFRQKNGKTNFETKISFDTTRTQKNKAGTEAKRRGITTSEFIRTAVDNELQASGEGRTFELLLLEKDIQYEEEQCEKLENELREHRRKLEEFKNEHTRKSKLISQANIVQSSEEYEIKNLILDRFGFHENYRVSFDENIRITKELANRNHLNIDYVTRILEMYQSNEIMLIDLIEKPLQNILDNDEVQSVDSESFQNMKNKLFDVYGVRAKQEKQQLQEKEKQKQKVEEQKQAVVVTPENKQKEIRRIITKLNEKETLRNIRNITNIKRRCRNMCQGNLIVKFEEVWRKVMDIVIGKSSIEAL